MLELIDRPIVYTTPMRLTEHSAWVEHIPFGMFLVDIARPSLLVELGTHGGDSYCGFCQAAVELGHDMVSHAVDTWAGDVHTGQYGPSILADLRAHHDPIYGAFSRLNVGMFDDVRETFRDGSIDLLHIDGAHAYNLVSHDFKSWLPKVSDRGIVLLHDTNVRQPQFGVARFWEEVQREYATFEFVHGHGLGVVAVGRRVPEPVLRLLNACREPEQAAVVRRYFAGAGARVARHREVRILQRKADEDAKKLAILDNRVRTLESLPATPSIQSPPPPKHRGPSRDLRRTLRRLDRMHRCMTDDMARLRAAVEAGTDAHQELLHDLRGVRRADAVTSGSESTYAALRVRLRRAVQEATPRGSIVCIISNGDEELITLFGRAGWHHPRTDDGTYLGYKPSCGLSAVVQLEASRAAGATHLAVPATAMWWLTHYRELSDYLGSRCSIAHRSEDVVVFELNASATRANDPPETLANDVSALAAVCRQQSGVEPALLDLTGVEEQPLLPASIPVFRPSTPPDADGRTAYLGSTVDLVLVSGTDEQSTAEARRIARRAIIVVDKEIKRQPGNAAISRHRIEWVGNAPRATPQPSTSIIIPCFNSWHHTERCLASLAETLGDSFVGEVIVVDDASTDATARKLAEWARRDHRHRVIRNAVNSGFIDSCNTGAAAASGEYLVLLNNDTLTLDGWLTELLLTFRLRPDAGAVGGMLLYPDGRLQEAGGIVFSDASAANFGRGDTDPTCPLYNRLRPVDYCSGALLATPRALFEQLGRLDPIYRPAYYEDTDYCFKVWASGRAVYYQPRSRVIHCEGASSGTDLSSGAKRYQATNRITFLRKWKTALALQPAPRDLSGSSWRYELADRDGFRGTAVATNSTAEVMS